MRWLVFLIAWLALPALGGLLAAKHVSPLWISAVVLCGLAVGYADRATEV